MAEATNSTEKPAVLIIGGLGYIGRFLALHIHQNNLASEVRLVDKVLPQLAWLAPEFSEACSTDKFMQADATREQSLPKIFTPSHATQYTYVFNCGGETRYSQDDSVYNLRSVTLTKTLARECAKRHLTYIEFSTGMVYKPPSSSIISAGGCTESSAFKPWVKLAKAKLQSEEECEKIRAEFSAPSKQGELRYAILRLAHVYGDYDVGFLARGLCLARVYQAKREEMKWLYGRDLRVNTVHVLDAVDAAWLAAKWAARVSDSDPELRPASSSSSSSSTPSSPQSFNPSLLASASARAFNISDSGDTSQHTISSLIGRIFSISTGFQNTLVNTFARFNLDSVVDDVNEDVLQPWADLLAEKGIVRQGPIGPFMEKELLRDYSLCLDSGRARRVLGWREGKGRERLSEEGVRGVVGSFGRMGWWP